MKWEISLSVFFASVLILINYFLYHFVIDQYITVRTEVFHERPDFIGFFHGRTVYWYVAMNAPMIIAIVLLVRVVKRWRKLKKRKVISH